jgi:hypothetical protein
MHPRRSCLLALLTLPATAAFGLYDPKPDEALAAVQGEWTGSLTYRDYSRPDRLVTLPTKLFVALSSPTELVLHYVFNDGPSKSVFSYERMQFDFPDKRLNWYSGAADKSPEAHKITGVTDEGSMKQLTFERVDGDKTAKHVLSLSPKAFRLSKEELPSSGEATFRNRYEFVRPGA